MGGATEKGPQRHLPRERSARRRPLGETRQTDSSVGQAGPGEL